LGVLVRSYDWKDLSQMNADFARRQQFSPEVKRNPAIARILAAPNEADTIRRTTPPRPLGSIEALPEEGSKVRQVINLDIGFCGTGLKKGDMPAGLIVEHTYQVPYERFTASPGVYRFQWRAYRPQGRDKSTEELSKAASNTVEITIAK
jgi:hypothetical protein